MNVTPNPTSPAYPLMFEDSRPLRTAALKSPTPNLLHGQTATLLDTTGTPGPGNVENLQIYVANGGGDQLGGASLWLRIFIDGETTASIYMPLHQLFFCFAMIQANTSPANSAYATDNVAMDYNLTATNFGGFRNIFIPYATSIKIQLVNFSATDDAILDSQVVYRAGRVPTFRTGTRKKRLRQSSSFANYTPAGIYEGFSVLNPLANQDIVNVSGVRGELESVGLLIWNNSLSTSDLPLEGTVQTYIDGAAIHTYRGTEDYFYNQVYGVGLNVRTSHGGLVYRGPIRDVGGHGSQWFKLMGRAPHTAEPFDSSLRINWTNGLAGLGSLAVSLLFNVLYYTDH